MMSDEKKDKIHAFGVGFLLMLLLAPSPAVTDLPEEMFADGFECDWSGGGDCLSGPDVEARLTGTYQICIPPQGSGSELICESSTCAPEIPGCLVNVSLTSASFDRATGLGTVSGSPQTFVIDVDTVLFPNHCDATIEMRPEANVNLGLDQVCNTATNRVSSVSVEVTDLNLFVLDCLAIEPLIKETWFPIITNYIVPNLQTKSEADFEDKLLGTLICP